MRIVKLAVENIKRISAVSHEPGSNPLIVVGGKNRAGKSSVLDSVAYALGGKDLIPTEPIRAGESEGRVTVDLGDLVVTRVFRRDRGECSCTAEGLPPDQHQIDCHFLHFGETRSTLTVKSKDGATYPSPQSMLDKLIGKLAFDPLAFATQAKDEPKRAAETLRQLVGLDLQPLDEMRKAAFEERTRLSRDLRTLEGALAALPHHTGVPEEEIGDEAVHLALEGAEQLRQRATDAQRAAEAAQRELATEAQALKHWDDMAANLERELAEAKKNREQSARRLGSWREKATALVAELEEAKALVPDLAAMHARLAEINITNQRVRENKRYAEKLDQTAALAERVDALTDRIKHAEEERERAIAAVRWPVPGLGWTPEGVTLNGVPFEQASSSEQLRAGVAIGLALNPKLQVLLVRNGNLLDEDGVRALAEQADAAGAQVWMEYVASGPDGVSVMIEDGHEAGKPA